jgi:hypothetical protein
MYVALSSETHSVASQLTSSSDTIDSTTKESMTLSGPMLSTLGCELMMTVVALLNSIIESYLNEFPGPIL